MSPLYSLLRLLRGTTAVSDVANVAVTNGLILVLNLVTGIITARLLGSTGRGELAALLLWPQFLGYAFAFALPSAVIYHARKQPARKAAFAGRAIQLSIVGGGLAAAAGVGLMPLLLQKADAITLSEARWMMGFAPFATVSTMFTALIQLEGNFHFYNFLRYSPLVLTAGSLLLLHVLGGLSPLTGALAYFLPGVPVFVWMAWWVGRHLHPTFAGPQGVAVPLLSYAARAYGGEAAGTVLGQIDKLVLVNLLSASGFGVYVVIFSLSRILTTVASSITPVLFPRTAGRPAEDVMRATERSLAVATPLLVVGALVFATLGGVALRTLYGADFVAGHAALGLLSLEAVFYCLAYILAQPFLALDRPGITTLIQLGSVPVLATLMWLLVPRFGVTGAAGALLITTFLRLLSTLATFRLFAGVRPPRVLPSWSAALQLLRRIRSAA